MAVPTARGATVHPPAPPSASPPPTPANIVAGLPGTLLALVTAIGGLITTYQSFQESQAISRASYEALKTAVDANTEALASQARAQVELRQWLQDLTDRLEERQNAQQPPPPRRPRKAAPAAPAPLETPPVPPPAPAVKRQPLPPFEALETPP